MPASPIMKFHDQDRQCGVILSAAKDLGTRRIRSFAALRMTGPVLMVKNHHRPMTRRCPQEADQSAVRQ